MADAMNITRAEMEIINYIMDHQPVTVRRVTQAMSSRRAGRSPARTTVLTLPSFPFAEATAAIIEAAAMTSAVPITRTDAERD